jgi:hypothetical protein
MRSPFLRPLSDAPGAGRTGGWQPAPREQLLPGPPALPGDGSADVARRQREAEQRARLEASRDRMAADVRHRPEDSSPGVRRMLGYADAPRPPHRWEQAVRYTVRGAELVNVDAGPVDPPTARPRRMRPL